LKIVGLITEYNPFHNGHVYHLAEAKRRTDADLSVAVMSGDFVQRGYPAITDKYTRTRMALEAGVDLVLELPVRFATGSAPRFAEGAVTILNALGCVTDLVYGCEAGDAAPLREIAYLLLEESAEFSAAIQEALRKGCSYPAAREAALKILRPDLAPLSETPNNILGIEYEKELLRQHSPIRSLGLLRKGSGYRETGSAIRASLYAAGMGGCAAAPGGAEAEASAAGAPPSPEDLLPESTRRLLSYCVAPEAFQSLIRYRIRMLSDEALLRYEDMTPELISRIRRFGPDPELVKCKNYTETRIRRSLLHVLLGIQNDTPAPAFIRILGFRKGTPVLKACSGASLPLVTKLADAPDRSWETDARASDIFDQIVLEQYGTKNPGEYLAGPIIL